MTSTLVGRLCEMPRVFRSRDVSLMALLRDIGLPAPFKVSEREIEVHFRMHPELIDDWVIYRRPTVLASLVSGEASGRW